MMNDELKEKLKNTKDYMLKRFELGIDALIDKNLPQMEQTRLFSPFPALLEIFKKQMSDIAKFSYQSGLDHGIEIEKGLQKEIEKEQNSK